MTRFSVLLFILSGASGLFAQPAPANTGLLHRRYQDGEKLSYRMTGNDNGRSVEIRATGVVKRDSAERYVEEYGWFDLKVNGSPVTLPPRSLEFRQTLSLDPDRPPSIPKLSDVHPALIGPITDFLTFYVDLWLAIRLGKLNRAGDHLYHEHGVPASWTDGNRTVLGEDSIDFDFTLTDIDPAGKVATLVIRHVPPPRPQVKLPANWMRQPVTATANNWVNVIKDGGKYLAAVGSETFDVQVKVSLADGKILAGTLENSVKARQRNCADAAFTNCDDSRPLEILRKIEVSLDR